MVSEAQERLFEVGPRHFEITHGHAPLEERAQDGLRLIGEKADSMIYFEIAVSRRK